jgi:hypothetical protein
MCIIGFVVVFVIGVVIQMESMLQTVDSIRYPMSNISWNDDTFTFLRLFTMHPVFPRLSRTVLEHWWRSVTSDY